ncbi:hypothetical protein J4D97_02330 [Hymenobacter defluvii]|uniref:MoxR-vWA-beta-propeller ternary system domain-containing protein n=2 Tax=Hymenobacter defluvii TaxID=2054411 RepID=A0ABS3T747_9BACT|nr:hypothetical protein [Hymenobacter defluvii]
MSTAFSYPMQLALRYHPAAQRPACAAFLRGTEPAAWLREIGRWGLSAEQLSCYLVPESIRSVRVAGLLVVAPEGTLPADVLEPCGVEAGRLYVPTHAALWPATTPEELSAALVWPRQLLHPSIGLVGFDTEDELDLSSLLELQAPQATDWGRAKMGNEPRPPLQQIRVQAPTAADVMQEMQEDVGTALLSDLPRPPGTTPGMLQKQWDNLRRGMLRRTLQLMQRVPNPTEKKRPGPLATGELLVGLLLLGLLLAGVIWLLHAIVGVDLDSFPWSTMLIVLVVLGSHLLRAAQQKDNSSQPAYPPVRRPAKLGLLTRLQQRWRSNLAELEKKRHNEIERLLRLFTDNPDEALKYAIPLGGPYQDRGTAAPSAQLGPRATEFNLGRLGGGGRVDAWNLDAYQQDLRQRYQASAHRETAAGHYQKAAYIYAHLLGDYPSAARVLEQGGFYREAATLYQEHLHNRPAAAQCLERGGLLLEAATLFAELEQHEKVGDLYQQLAQTDLAARHYERGVALLLTNHDHPAAARLLNDKLASPDRAQTVLIEGWTVGRQPEACLRQHFNVVAAVPGADLSTQVRKVFQHHTPREQLVPLLQVLSTLSEKYAAPELRTTTREVAYEIVGAEAATGNLVPLNLLHHFLPDDPLLASDCNRFTTRQACRLTDAAPALYMQAPQLDATVQWQQAVGYGAQWLAVGVRNQRLHLARANWYGHVEYYSWTTPLEDPRVQVLADEQHGNQIILRSAAGAAFETKQLSQNKHFPQSLTVRCPSWLPPWPTRVALLPNKCIASVWLEGTTLLLHRYDAAGPSGLLLATQTYQPDVPVPLVDSGVRVEPYELLYYDSLYYTCFDNAVVWAAEDGRCQVYSKDEYTYSLTRSAYLPNPCFAVSTEEGLQLWMPTQGADEAPQQVVFDGGLSSAASSFVGVEHLVAINDQATVYHLTEDGAKWVKRIKTPTQVVAVLPTTSRQQFALLETNGRVSLHTTT